jgi:hypothetical protein
LSTDEDGWAELGIRFLPSRFLQVSTSMLDAAK